jgi:hypothetical protein
MTVGIVLEDDAALGGVVAALAGIGSHILALRKSEPSLEDVFVELVGRGFDEESVEEAPPAPDRTPDPRDESHQRGEREEEEAVV